MAMNRTHMRRQLYRGGGITSIPRQGYGLGDIVKKVGERVRKLIPNEIADVAVKAAPFVAPFNPIAAGLMRGVGRYDQRGSLSDALKQGIATYGLGQGARYLGGAKMQTGFNPMGGMEGMKYGVSNPMGAWSGPKTPATIANTRASDMPAHLGEKGFKLAETDQSPLNKILFGEKGGEGFFGEKGLIGAKGAFDMKGAFGKGVPAVFAGSTLAALATQKALGDVGGREPGESLAAFNKRRESTVSNYLAYYYKRANKFRIPPEELEQKTAEFVKQNTTEYRTGESHGGRIGYGLGNLVTQNVRKLIPNELATPAPTGGVSMANTLAENIRRNQAQQQAVGGMFEAARSKLPGYTAPVVQEATVTPQIESPYMSPSVPRDPIPREALTAGFEDYLRDNPNVMSGAGTMGMIPATLPGGYEHAFSGSTEANAFNKYLESIGQPSWTKREDPMLTGFDYSQPTNWSPGQAAPEGYRVVNMMGDEFLERMYPSKEEIGGMPMGLMVSMPDGSHRPMMPGMMPPLEEDPYEGLSGQEYAEKYGIPYNQGGRVGLYGGGEAGIKSLDAGAPDITYEGNEGPQAPMKMASYGYDDAMAETWAEFQRLRKLGEIPLDLEFDEWLDMQDFERHIKGPVLPEDPTKPINPWAPKPTGPALPDKMMAAKGGRIGYKFGPGPVMDPRVAQPQGLRGLSSRFNFLPGPPRMAPDGIEFDMRENGGFQPLGAKEGKDDVNAKLAKNEFVFTADAVRGAGGGDIELGAQRMYDTMKNLEKRE